MPYRIELDESPPDRLRQGFLYGPIVSENAVSQGSVGYSGFSGPSGEAKGLAVKRVPNSVSLIAGLLRSCGPTTVAWLIVAIIINAIKTMPFGGSVPHVEMKRLKRLSPPGANNDPSPPVALVEFIIRVMATVLHGRPNGVRQSPGHLVLGANL